MKLRIVQDASTPLSVEELQQRGNQLVTDARRAALRAIAVSMQPEYVEREHSVQRRDLIRWRRNAAEARDEWQKVVDATTELLTEIDRTAQKPEVQDHERENDSDDR
jgi:hypothetical protein